MNKKPFTEREKKQIIDWYVKDNLSINKIVEKTNIWKPRITSLLKENNIFINHDRRNHKYKYNENFFSNIDTQDKAYILGLFFADGCVHSKRNAVSLGLQEIDKNILEQITKCLVIGNKNLRFANNIIKNHKNVVSRKNTYTFEINNEKIKDDLIRLGCTPKKSFTLKFPNIDEKLQNHFIRGYFDGDGCMWVSKKNKVDCVFSILGTFEFLETVQNILYTKCGLNKTKIQKQSSIFRLQYGRKKSCDKFKDYIYRDANMFLRRKYDKFLEISG